METGTDDLFSIGEASKISGVSTRMLRHYDKIALIKPEYVDSDNNYRYYSEEQILYLSFINELKISGYKLSEIKLFFNIDNPEILMDFFNEKISQIEEKQKKLIKSKERLKDFVKQVKLISGQIKNSHKNGVGKFSNIPQRKVIFTKYKSKYSAKSFLTRFAELQNLVQKFNVTVTGPYMAVFPVDFNSLELNKSEFDFEFCVEVKTQESLNKNYFRTIPQGFFLTLFFNDEKPHETTKKVYNKALEMINKHGYKKENYLIKRYFHRKSISANSSVPYSEIQIPILK